MKIYRLAQLVISKAEDGLWYDHDERSYDEKGWGFAFRLFAGDVVRPITRPRYWFADGVPSKWNEFDPKYHTVLKFWLPVAPFLSVALGRFGFYLGFKVFDLSPEKYRPMVGDAQFAGSQALTLSATTRATRWK